MAHRHIKGPGTTSAMFLCQERVEVVERQAVSPTAEADPGIRHIQKRKPREVTRLHAARVRLDGQEFIFALSWIGQLIGFPHQI